MTALEAITKGTEFLQRKGVDSPRLQAELLLAHVLKLSRLKLYLNFERVLKQTESDALRELIVQRGNRIPLQHLLGSTSFWGFEIAVSRAVLIPRPETETLAELVWLFLKGLDRETTFLDLGTGSACIPIAVTANVATTRGVAVDISKEALAVATTNVAASKLADRIELREGDLFAALAAGERFDAIVSNPPYIPSADIETLQAEVRDHDPRGALDGGADGLEFYRIIAARAGEFLKPGGRVFLEFGDGQAPALRELFECAGWTVEKIVRDLSQRERVLIAARSPAN